MDFEVCYAFYMIVCGIMLYCLFSNTPLLVPLTMEKDMNIDCCEFYLERLYIE